MTNSAFGKQIQNRNFLSGVAFKFNLTKFPKVDFFSNSARIPELTLELTTQPSYLKNIDVPGERLTFGDLTLRFLVDENMENYISVYNWLTGLGFPETTKEFADLIKDKFSERFIFKNKKFSQLNDIKLRYENIKGVIFDLGYSYTQIKDPTKGLSFN